MSLGLAAIVAVQTLLAADGLSKEDLVRLAKTGATDETVIALINREGAPTLAVDDLIALKQAGLSDRVLEHILANPRKGELVVVNRSVPDMRVTVDTANRIISWCSQDGESVAPGTQLSLSVPEGEYALPGTIDRMTVPGRITLNRVEAGESFVTMGIIEDPERRSVILDLTAKPKPIPQPDYRPYVQGPPPLLRERRSIIPFVPDTVALGAGLGAIIGHQRGERTKGALIGAGVGMLLEFLRWRH
jgi:hypothetical protein